MGRAAAPPLAGGLLLGGAGVDLRLLPGRNGGGLAFQLGLAGTQPRQAVLAPRQSLGQRLAAVRAE